MSSARRQVQLLLVDGPYMLRLSASKRPGDGFCSWTRSPPPTRSQPGRLSWRRMRTISGCGARGRRLGQHAVARPKVGRRWSRPGRGGRRPWGTSSRTSYSVTHVHRRPPGRANGLGRRKARLPQTLAQLLGDSTPWHHVHRRPSTIDVITMRSGKHETPISRAPSTVRMRAPRHRRHG